jgi:signal transduction histidine kinase
MVDARRRDDGVRSGPGGKERPVTERGAARLAWTLWAIAIALALSAGALLVISWSTPPPEGAFGFRGFAAMFAITFGTVGALVASRQPRNPIGWIALASGIVSGVQGLANEYAIWAMLGHDPPLALGEFAAWFPAWIWIPATSGAAFILLLFPNGRLLSARWWWVVGLAVAGVVLASAGFALIPGPLENFRDVPNPFGIASEQPILTIAIVGETIYGVAFILSAIAVFLRFRRSRGDERQQMKWLVAAGVFLAVTLVSSFAEQIVNPAPVAQSALWVALLVITGFASLPIAMGFAILKYRLYDIDVVISKAVVYGTLAAFITLIYLIIVAGIGAIAGSGGNVFLSAVAAAVVAVAFQPARRWAQRLADRLVYGKRASPYEVLSGFSERLGDAYSIDEVLPRLTRVLAEGIGADRVVVWLGVSGSLRPAAGWPDTEGLTRVTGLQELPDRAFEVRHQGELLGAITVTMPPSDPLDQAQEKLVADVANQAGLVMRNVALLEDLQESRRRIVAAQDERARKLERNIHDGAQQQLVALAVKQRLAASLIGTEDDRARVMLEELQAETQVALDDLRDLARGIYPPLLADKGLAAALEAQARRSPVPVTVEADGVGRLGQDVEAAVYFCVLEALQNIAKYAEASNAVVRLSNGIHELAFEVTDDGVGFDPASNGYGTGLQGMADRLSALRGELHVRSTPGAGTTIAGRLPVERFRR